LTTEKLVDLVVQNLKTTEQSKYRYLIEPDLNQRLRYLLEDISKTKDDC
jgi:hypothetical protein